MSLIILLLYTLTNLVKSSFTCGITNITQVSGTLTSPEFNVSYPKFINCTWTIIPPNDKQLSVRINYLDVTDCNKCCAHNFLKLSNGNHDLAIYCNGQKPRTITLHEEIVHINFQARNYTKRHKGFELEFISVKLKRSAICEGVKFRCFDGSNCVSASKICDEKYDCNDHSDEINCSNCSKGQASCSDYSKKCFSPVTQRCNGILDCPKGEDELNCTLECLDKLRCASGNQCYSKEQICDGKSDCLDSSDESNCFMYNCKALFNIHFHFMCRNRRCIDRKLVNNGVDDCGDSSDEFVDLKRDNLMALSIFLGIFMSVSFTFLICRWLMARRNVNYLIANPPEFPARQIRYDYEEEVPNPDMQSGGAIFESYMETRRRRESGHRRRTRYLHPKIQTIFRRNLNHPIPLQLLKTNSSKDMKTKGKTDNQYNSSNDSDASSEDKMVSEAHILDIEETIHDPNSKQSSAHSSNSNVFNAKDIIIDMK